MPPKKSSQADILLDARMIRNSGIGTYLHGLIEEYRDHPYFRERRLELTLPPRLYAESDGVHQVSAFYSPIYSVREQLEYPFRLERCRLWHAPHYNVPFSKKKTKLVVTIHDLIHWIFRQEFYSTLQAAYARFFLKKAVSLADRIIAVSQRTRDDLIQHFGAQPDQVRVIYEGVAMEFFYPPDENEREEVLEKYGLPRRFFLYVGLIKPHKNVKRLIEVFERLRQEGKLKSALVLVGKKDRRYPAGFEELRYLKTGEGIYYLPKIESRRELSCLYASARTLVHPSLYEGFGLTCLEAMASGTPVVVSETASLPEVVGEAGYSIDPYSNDSLAEGLLKMEESDSLRRELAERGKIRAREFTWAKTAEKTIDVYEEVLR